jgi:hypothetical protein
MWKRTFKEELISLLEKHEFHMILDTSEMTVSTAGPSGLTFLCLTSTA